MTFPGPTRVGALLLALVCAAARLDAGQGDVVTRARSLAVAGQRADAITLLQTAVAESPDNSDARVLLGAVLSWEGRYDEARRELEAVLVKSPTHGDALPAAINVELWSDHPQRAEELARRGLQERPDDPGYLLARARALVALQRPAEARVTLERLLVIDPRNEQGTALRRSLRSLPPWQARIGGSYDAFSDRVAWRESEVSLGRATPVGSILVRGSHAERYGLEDNQVEVEAYPRLRPGAHAYVAGAYAPKAVLYPQYRFAAELYQSLGAGFEGSAGFRRLRFGRGVNIYVGSLSKYYGNWLFTGRVFVTPDSAGRSRTVHASFRRYLGDAGTYVGMRYGRGARREELRTLNDLDVLDSDVGAAETAIILGRRVELKLNGSYSREDRVDGRDVRGYSVVTGLGVRF